MHSDTFTPSSPSSTKQYASPLRLLALILISVFVAEAAVMLLFLVLNLSPLLQTFLDAFLLVVLVFPALYRYLLRPLSVEIDERRQAEAALQQARDELEVRVQERTAELTLANQELQDEIVERQQIETRLRDSEQKYSALFDKSPFAIVLTRMSDGTVVSVNDASLKLFEYTWAEVSEKTSVELGIIDSDLRTQVVAELSARGSVQDFEVTHTTKSGTRHVLSLNLNWISLGGEKHILTTFHDITERKRMEDDLRRAHDELELRVQERTAALAQLSSAVEQTADTVVITDCNGMIEYVNPALERLTGYTKEEVLGHTPRLLKSGVHDDRFYQELWDTILRGEVFFGEITNRKKNGELWHEVKTIAPIRDAQGTITHFVATGKDITERKRAEQALQQSEKKFRALFETAPVGISVLDQNYQLTDANEALKRIIRLTQDGLLAGAYQNRKYIRSDGMPMLPAEFASTRAIAENRPVQDVEVGIVTEDEQIIWTMVSAAPLGLPEASVVVITQDITERKRAQEQINLQIAAMEAAANGIVITDRAGRILWTNPAFTRMSGYAPLEVLGQSTRLFKSGQHDWAYYHQLWETIVSGQVWHGETINRRKDGNLYTEDQTIAPVRDAQGNITHFVSIKQDITEHKQAEQAVQWERAKLKSILNAMQDGVYIVTPDCDIEYVNPALEREFGPVNQRKCYAYLFGQTEVCAWCHNTEVFAGNTLIWEHEWLERGKTYELFDTPVRNANGRLSKLAIFHDITARKRAEEEIGRRNRELAALNTISAAVSRSLELPEVLLTLTRLLLEDLGIPGGAIFLYDESTDQLQFETDWGTPGALRDVRFNAAIPANAFHSPRVIRNKEPLLTHDVRHAVESVSAKLRISQPDWQDYLCVPLVAQDRLQGVLDLFSRAPAQFDADDVDFFKSLGLEVGMAIRNARLYQAEQHARQTAETLRAASLALTQTLDLEAVVNTLLDYVEQLIPYDAANVMLLETKERLTVRAARDYEQWEDGDQVRRLTYDVSSIPIIQQLFDERRSLIIADRLAQPDRGQGLHLAPARSWLGVPLIAGGNVIGLYSLIKVEPNYFTLRHTQLAEALVGQAAVAVQNAWLFEQVRQGREQLQDLSRRLVEIQESERRYVARELHDEAGQALTSLMVGLRLLERDAGQPEALKRGIAELNHLVDGVQENLHRLAMDLRPASLDHLGLVAALRQYMESLSDKHGLVVQFEAVGLGHERLPSDVETAVYRIVQEALTNVVRHAHATRVDVLLERRGDRLAAIVEDNGVGFDAAQPQTGRLGLFGIRERAEMLGGTLLIESSEHSGTTLVAEVSCAS